MTSITVTTGPNAKLAYHLNVFSWVKIFSHNIVKIIWHVTYLNIMQDAISHLSTEKKTFHI